MFQVNSGQCLDVDANQDPQKRAHTTGFCWNKDFTEICSGRNQVLTKHGRMGEGWAARARERNLREKLTMCSKLEKGIIKQTCIRIFRKQALP